MVRALIQQLGIEGCGGQGRGLQALSTAEFGHADIMAMLVDAGVVDTGRALVAAARWGNERNVKFRLEQQQQHPGGIVGTAHVNAVKFNGWTPSTASIEGIRSCSPKVVRLLVDAVEDTTLAVRPPSTAGGEGKSIDTHVDLAIHCLRERKVNGKDATEE